MLALLFSGYSSYPHAFVFAVTAITVTVALVPSVISVVIPAADHDVINAYNVPVAGSWRAVNVIPNVLKVSTSQSLAVRSVIIIVKLVTVSYGVSYIQIQRL